MKEAGETDYWLEVIQSAGYFSDEEYASLDATSRTNELLHDEHTGLYLMSDLYIVDEVIRELRNEARAETK